MSTVTGTVESMGKDGKKFKVNGGWYSAYNAKQLSGAEQGDTVSFDYKENGQWKNITGNVTIVEKGAGGATTTTFKTDTQKVGSVILDRDRTIARQNALTNARELVIHWSSGHDNFYPDLDGMVQDIIKTAYKLEAYTTGDKEKENAKKAFEQLQEQFNS